MKFMIDYDLKDLWVYIIKLMSIILLWWKKILVLFKVLFIGLNKINFL